MTNTGYEGAPFIRYYRPQNTRTKRSKYFLLGLILSAILCIIALALSQIIWAGYENVAKSDERCEKKVVGFYRLSYGGELTESQLSKLTHVIFSSFWYSEKDDKIQLEDEQDEPVFKTVVERAGRFELMKMFNVKDLNPDVIRNNRKVISKAITNFIETHQLDGVNIEWPDPKSTSGNENLIQLCESVREHLNVLAETSGRTRPYVISVQFPQTKSAMDFERLLKSVDFLNLDISHYYCSWYNTDHNHLTGPASPLFSGHSNDTKRNVDDTMRHYSCVTQKPNRLVMIFAFSGRYWNNVVPPKNPNDDFWMVAEKINGSVHGGWSWWRNMKKKGWDLSSAKWNSESKTSYIWVPETRTQYHIEDERSLKEKVKYAMEKNIGGVGVWNTSEDDDEDTLLNVFAEGGLCPRRDDISVNYYCD